MKTESTVFDGLVHKIVIDFETFYSQKYSLKNLPTQNYIMSSEFEVIGAAIKFNNQPTVWYSSTFADMKEWLSQIPWERVVVVAHNAAFEGAILEWVFGFKPAAYICTASMGRALYSSHTGSASLAALADHLNVGQKGTEVLDAKGKRRVDFTAEQLEAYGKYCIQDVDLANKLLTLMTSQFPKSELAIIDATIKKFTRPTICIEPNQIRLRITELSRETEQWLETAASILGTTPQGARAVLMSNPKVAEALRNLGVEPPMKTSPTTGRQTLAFAKSDLGFQALLEHPNKAVVQLIKARLALKSTIEFTRLHRYLDIANLPAPHNKLAVPLKYYGGHTGRFSGSDKLNAQNLPRGGSLRKALVAPKGHVIMAADLAQIEARILAVLARQDDLVLAFKQNRDTYSEFASTLFGRPINKTDHPNERFIGKAAVLGCGYGLGAKAFRDYARALGGVDISEMEAHRTIKTYRRVNHKIVQLWRALDEAITHMRVEDMPFGVGPIIFESGRARLPNGMNISYPDLQFDTVEGSYSFKRGRARSKLWGGTLTENCVQALARIILTDAELRLANRGLVTALSVHDELVAVVPEEKIEWAKKLMETQLTRPVEWMKDLPLACEVSYGESYADAK